MLPFPSMPERLEENQNSGSFRQLRTQYKGAFATLEGSDPLATALSFAALLLNENLQSSTYRIETLVNLAISLGRGKNRLKQRDFRKLYGEMEKGVVARQEDPAEDVFVSNISTLRGNFLVLEGLSEGAGYFLQVFMQMVDSLPEHESYDVIREPVYALLTLSDEACKRAGLLRNQLGNEIPQAKLTPENAGRISALRNCLTFDSADLEQLGLKPDDLGSFGFDPSKRARLLEQSLLHNDLERYPVAHKDGATFLLLPTAVSGGIRRFVFEMLTKAYGLETFLGALAYEYSKRLNLIPFLGESGRVRLEFTSAGETLMASVFRWVDDGRALHLYNIVEATTTRTLDTVGCTVVAERPKDWSTAVRKEWVRAAIWSGDDRIGEGAVNKLADISAALSSGESLSAFKVKGEPGSWDDDAIKKVADRLGCRLVLTDEVRRAAYEKVYRDETTAMGHLAKRRNAIAHGSSTFEDGANDLTLDDLKSLGERILPYLREVAESYRSFLDNKAFLAPKEQAE